jgi:hypothetical protein
MYREEENVTKKKLSRAYKNERDYLAKYIDQPILKIKYKLKSQFKSLFVYFFGAPTFLLERRNEPVGQEQNKSFNHTLQLIENTTIDGS